MEEQISPELLSRCLERNWLHAPVPQDNTYAVSLLPSLPVHLYCLVEQESVCRIHTNGLFIPS